MFEINHLHPGQHPHCRVIEQHAEATQSGRPIWLTASKLLAHTGQSMELLASNQRRIKWGSRTNNPTTTPPTGFLNPDGREDD